MIISAPARIRCPDSHSTITFLNSCSCPQGFHHWTWHTQYTFLTTPSTCAVAFQERWTWTPQSLCTSRFPPCVVRHLTSPPSGLNSIYHSSAKVFNWSNSLPAFCFTKVGPHTSCEPQLSVTAQGDQGSLSGLIQEPFQKQLYTVYKCRNWQDQGKQGLSQH